jgi:AhpD family alkylhydroperoxidase
MPQKYRHRRDELNKGFIEINRALPGVMKAFAQLHREATADGALAAKYKEMIALAVGITSHCDGCIALHVHDALKAGATREEMVETIGVAVLMGGGPSAIYGIDALEAMEQFTHKFAENHITLSD